MKNLLPFTLILFSLFAKAQERNLTQTIRGTVYDQDTRQSIIGANIIVLNSDPFKGTTTDINGRFVLQNVPVGRVSLQVTFLGYEPQVLSNLVVNSAKELVIDVTMVESVTTLKTVEISAKENKGEVQNDMATVSARSFTVEETGRFAGSFNDPARMASGFAGVTGDPEGNNDISVRGNSPKGILWRLEGMEIPNPNHFGAEGGSGGPISILNADLLDESEFYTGAFPAEYGNAISGVFDISLRKGNNQSHEFAAGISALGVDVTAEGPMSLSDGASYLMNYRYSSLGLLDQLNIVDFGGIPNYQDGAFKTFIPTDKVGSFSVYGMGGLNSIQQEFTDSSEERVVQQTVFNGGMGVVGVNHFLPIGKKAYLKTSVALSGSKEESLGRQRDENEEWITDWEDLFTTVNARASTQLNAKLTSKHKIQTGVIYSNLGYNYTANYNFFDGEGLQQVLDKMGSASTFQSYAQWKIRPSVTLDVNLGLHHYYFTLNNNQTLEPRLGVKWGFAPQHFLNFGAGLHSKLEPISTYLANYKRDGFDIESPNRNLELMKAAHFVLGHEFYPNINWQLKSEIYFQYLYDVPQGTGQYDHFVAINQNNWFVDFPMQNSGEGRNYGIEFAAERFFANGWFGLTTVSLYQSEYKNEKGVWTDTRFNSEYTWNVIGGKEFDIGNKNNRSNVLGFSGKTGIIGGRYFTPIDLQASIAAEETVFDNSRRYKVKADPINFVNIAVYYKINKEKTTQEIKFDVQNLFNAQSKVRPYFNAAKGEVEYTTQLGFLPNISYRIYF